VPLEQQVDLIGSENEAADELRPVTALFADVVGSTSLGERLAPHEVKALIGECVSRMARVVEQYGGTVQSFMGDGIAAFFGMPAAHEDDPAGPRSPRFGLLMSSRNTRTTSPQPGKSPTSMCAWASTPDKPPSA